MIHQPVRSKCCEAPVKMGHKRLKTGRKDIIWICVRCKKRDVDLVDFINGKVVKPKYFASDQEEEEETTLGEDL